MGLAPNQQFNMEAYNNEGGTYFYVYQGQFAKKVQAGTEGAVARTNKLGKEVTEMFYKNLKFTPMALKHEHYELDGGRVQGDRIIIQTSGATLSLEMDSSVGEAFVKMLPNIDLNREMTLSINKEDDKTSLFVKQNGVNLKHAFTKDAPNGMPAWKKVVVSGKEVWDKTDLINWAKKLVDEKAKTITSHVAAPAVAEDVAEEI
jgi:hypothetical protein